MKHKHAELIKAKADNMDLVVFFTDGGAWRKIPKDLFPVSQSDSFEYFICHPKHEKECLHWLNGGEVKMFDEDEWCDLLLSSDWNEYHALMNGSLEFRIKPRKEKRWIAVKDGKAMSNYLFESENEARVICGCAGHDAQLIEIEVEV